MTWRVAKGTPATLLSARRCAHIAVRQDNTFAAEQLVLDRDSLQRLGRTWHQAWPELDALDHVIIENAIAAGSVCFGKRVGREVYLLLVDHANVTILATREDPDEAA